MNAIAQQKFHQRIRIAIVGFVLAVGGLPSAALAGGSLSEQWVARYNGTANSSDWGNAGVVDSRDNVIVTGTSVGNVNGVFSTDTATIKYNSRGKEVWVARDIGGAKGLDVAVDANDNVYVTNNYATIKYDAAGGLVWRVAVHGTVLAADAAGNVYVTGGVGGTVKLDASGATQWSVAVSGRAVALDAAGNVYVAGNTTVKLDPNNGQTLWSAPVAVSLRFPLAVDASGNVYVSGNNTALGNVTAKYDTNGNQLWMTPHSIRAYAIAADAAGNAYIISSTSMSVAKFDSAVGNMLWNSSATAGYAINLAVSDRGDVYVGGGYSNNFLTVKFNSAGVQEATATYNNGSWDDVYDFVIDSRGNPIVIGESFSVVNGYSYSDFATVKYSR